MEKTTLILLIWILSLLACVRTNPKNMNRPLTNNQNDTTKDNLIIRSPSETVVSFLKYYRENPEGSFGSDFTRYPKDKDSSMFYRVDFDYSNKFLDRLHNTGYLSDTYIKILQKYFKNQDSLYIHDPIQRREPDSPPLLFDGDLIMQSNSWWQDNLKYLDSAKIIVQMISKDISKVSIRFQYGDSLIYYLGRYNSIWLIDSILNRSK
jgi:hypothetical protein